MPKDLIVKDEDVSKVAKALASGTRWKILKLLKVEALDVSRIAEKLGQTEANISAQIKIMENANLIETHYEPGVTNLECMVYEKYVNLPLIVLFLR
jgi:predicted transcriptional regulator